MCWGANNLGQLGNSEASTDSTATPVAVDALTNITAIDAGEYFTCVIDTTDVRCWGSAPGFQADYVDGPEAISAGGDHACAIDSNRYIECWGSGTGYTTLPSIVSW